MRPGFGPALKRLVNSQGRAAARRPQRVDSHAASGVPRRLRHVGPGRTAQREALAGRRRTALLNVRYLSIHKCHLDVRIDVDLLRTKIDHF